MVLEHGHPPAWKVSCLRAEPTRDWAAAKALSGGEHLADQNLSCRGMCHQAHELSNGLRHCADQNLWTCVNAGTRLRYAGCGRATQTDCPNYCHSKNHINIIIRKPCKGVDLKRKISRQSLFFFLFLLIWVICQVAMSLYLPEMCRVPKSPNLTQNHRNQAEETLI